MQNLLSSFLNDKDEDLSGYLNDICAISRHVAIYYLWRPFLKDYKDDKVLEGAFSAGAGVIVTHNLKDFKNVKEEFGIEVKLHKWQ